MLLTLKIKRLLSDDDVAYEKGVPWSVCDDLTQKAIVKSLVGGDQLVSGLTTLVPQNSRLCLPAVQPSSTLQESQPSPTSVLPSSQDSPGSSMLLPQTETMKHVSLVEGEPPAQS